MFSTQTVKQNRLTFNGKAYLETTFSTTASTTEAKSPYTPRTVHGEIIPSSFQM